MLVEANSWKMATQGERSGALFAWDTQSNAQPQLSSRRDAPLAWTALQGTQIAQNPVCSTNLKIVLGDCRSSRKQKLNSLTCLKVLFFLNFRGRDRNPGPFWVEKGGICVVRLRWKSKPRSNNKPSLPFGDKRGIFTYLPVGMKIDTGC